MREGETLRFRAAAKTNAWTLGTNNFARRRELLVAADGRNSTVARLCHLMPRKGRDRVALQTHVPIPPQIFGERVVLQLLREGYSGQAPVGDGLLNLCLVSRPHRSRRRFGSWAEKEFAIPAEHNWRTIAPLARAPLPPTQPGLFLVGDAARVVEPFTGEGIYYALRSGELAAEAIVAGRARAITQPRIANFTPADSGSTRSPASRSSIRASRARLLRLLPNERQILRLLTTKVVRP